MFVHTLDQHLQRDLVFSTLRNDDICASLARLHELFVHRLHGREILADDALKRPSPLLNIPHDPP